MLLRLQEIIDKSLIEMSICFYFTHCPLKFNFSVLFHFPTTIFNICISMTQTHEQYMTQLLCKRHEKLKDTWVSWSDILILNDMDDLVGIQETK